MNIEEWIWDQEESEINNFHRDNGILTTYIFLKFHEKKVQTQIYFGVGTQNNNDKADRDI